MSKSPNDKVFNEILNTPPSSSIITSIVAKALTSCCDIRWNKINNILKYIKNNNRQKLKNECYLGLPDDLPCLRALIWKLNLKYIPSDITKWDKHLSKKRKEYLEIKSGFALKRKAELEIFLEIESSKSEEEKKKLFLITNDTDRILLETIDKDVNRTHFSYDFFSKPVKENSILTNEQVNDLYLRKRNCSYQDFKQVYTKGKDTSSQIETHGDVIGRILYIYAKLHRDIEYIQGMNEVLAPIYYCYSIDNSIGNSPESVEADTYWSFENLMKDIKRTFIKEKDNQKDGIFSIIKIFESLIERKDKEIFNHFKKNDIELIHFAFKWFNLLFSQDFNMPDILRLWDTLFSEEDKFYFLYFFSLGVLENKRKEILSTDFYGILKIVQNIELNDIEELISTAIKIKDTYAKKLNPLIYKK